MQPERIPSSAPRVVAGSSTVPLPEAESRDRSPAVIAYGLVAVVSMLFGFAIGLLF